MFKKNLIIWVGILGLLLAGSGQALAGKTIVNGIDANFPPFAFIDKTGTPSGFDVEAVNWIAKEMGYEVTHKAFDWDGIVTSLLTKKIDMVASGMSITPDRLKKVSFTNPYWKIEQVMVVKIRIGLDPGRFAFRKKTDWCTAGNIRSQMAQGRGQKKWLEPGT